MLFLGTSFTLVPAVNKVDWSPSVAQGVAGGMIAIPRDIATAIRATSEKIENALSELYTALGSEPRSRERSDTGNVGYIVGTIAGYLFAINLLNRGLSNLQQRGLISSGAGRAISVGAGLATAAVEFNRNR